MPIKTVDAPTLTRWLAEGEAVLVDVREPAEYAALHIYGATLLPLPQISSSSLPACAGKKLVIHCQKGGRGQTACQKLLQENPALEIYNLEGGVQAWQAAGLATCSSRSLPLPIDRQVQLTIGLCLLISSVLGYFFSPLFFLLTGVFGAGLSFAGLTGHCGLATLLAKMPWNQ